MSPDRYPKTVIFYQDSAGRNRSQIGSIAGVTLPPAVVFLPGFDEYKRETMAITNRSAQV